MSTFFCTAGTFVLGSVFTNAATASPAMDAAFNLPDWSERAPSPALPLRRPLFTTIRSNPPAMTSPHPPTPNHDSCTSCNQCSSGNAATSARRTPAAVAAHQRGTLPPAPLFLHRSRPDSGTVVGNNPFTAHVFKRQRLPLRLGCRRRCHAWLPLELLRRSKAASSTTTAPTRQTTS